MTEKGASNPLFRSDKHGNIVVDASGLSCRNCSHFVRVRDPKTSFVNDAINRRGFCSLGHGGDFGLYLSRDTCDGHAFSAYSLKTYSAEKQLSDFKEKMRFGAYDRRTKQYKILKTFIDTVKKESPKEDGTVASIFYDDVIINRATDIYMARLLRDKLNWLSNRRYMKLSEYEKMIGYMQLLVSNQLQEPTEVEA